MNGLYESKHINNYYDNWSWNTEKLTVFCDSKGSWRQSHLQDSVGKTGYGNGNSFPEVPQPRWISKRSRARVSALPLLGGGGDVGGCFRIIQTERGCRYKPAKESLTTCLPPSLKKKYKHRGTKSFHTLI